ncbi:tetratricopeptide repeat protein [Candidatus Uabimicrobium sp. HlEnr_7]|uniref:tetratricopeptide repeat protein n=1 Tax=Candidatus Uabimicrobium helgolandensis TaxID=3095367 RepID=UPI003555FD19
MSEQIKKLYKRTEEALKRNNYDLAIELLKNQILKFTPNDVKARKLLRATVKKKHQAHGAPTKGQAMSKGIGAQAKLKFAQMRKKWDTVIEESENYLLHDPTNVPVLFALGEACMHSGHTDTAIFVFEDLYSIDSSHVKSLVKLSEVHKNLGNYDKAIFYCQKAAKLSPTDGDISREVKRIAAMKTTNTYTEAKSSRDLIKDKDKANILEKLNQKIRSKEDAEQVIAIIKRQLQEEPENKKLIRDLAEKYLIFAKYDPSGYDQAGELLQKYLELDPTNFDTKYKIATCKIDKLNMQIDILQKKQKKNPQDANIAQQAKQLKKKKLSTEVEEYRVLVEERPTESELRYRLGKALFQLKQFDEAIANFQQAIQSPGLRVEALNYMGQAFLHKQNYSLAEAQFKSALEGLASSHKAYKTLLYSLGVVYESADKKAEAINTFTSLMNIDIQYKDVSARLDKLRVS